jgi:hypothetical protein
VDPTLLAPHGPHKIQKIGTISVPRVLLRELGLDVGDSVHWLLNTGVPGSLLLVPSAALGRLNEEVLNQLKERSR